MVALFWRRDVPSDFGQHMDARHQQVDIRWPALRICVASAGLVACLAACKGEESSISGGDDVPERDSGIAHVFRDSALAMVTDETLQARGLPSETESLLRIQELVARGRGIKELSGIERLTSLEVLDLGHNALTDIAELRALTRLQVLDISDNELTDLGPVGALKDLESLFAGHNDLPGIEALEELAQLSYVDLVATPIPESDVVVQRLRRRGVEVRLVDAQRDSAHTDSEQPLVGVLAFVSNRGGAWDIYLLDLSDETVQVLTDGMGQSRLPTWSPDGKRIAFMSDRTGTSKIYVVSADGGDIEQVTYGDRHDGEPTWRPDGRALAFFSTREGCSLCEVDLESGGVRSLVSNHDVYQFPGWSPDGLRFVFVRFPQVAVLSLPDMVETVLSDDSAVSRASWDPEGRWVAMSLTRDGYPAIYTAEVTDGGIEGLARIQDAVEGVEHWPSWSPDGHAIAYSAKYNTDSEIFVVHPFVGDLPINVTAHPAVDLSPAWRP